MILLSPFCCSLTEPLSPHACRCRENGIGKFSSINHYKDYKGRKQLCRHLKEECVWQRLVQKKFCEDSSFRKLCLLNDWWRHLPSQGGGDDEREGEMTCRRIVHKVMDYDDIWNRDNLTSTKLMAGGLFSCLKLHRNWLLAGMVDGLIKMWDTVAMRDRGESRKPLRVFIGHEESVTCLDAGEGVLVSGSLDRSVRIWSLETSYLLRVLRREGSPIVNIKLLSDRLCWWSRSGAFQISSWRGHFKVEPMYKFNITEDPNTCLMVITPAYIVTNQTDPGGFSTRDVIIYSSKTGMRLFEKDIFASKDITCLDVEGHLLFIGSGNTIEVWDINISSCLAFIQSSCLQTPVLVKSICVTDFIMVGMLSTSQLISIPLKTILEHSLISRTEPAIINWSTTGFMIENTELSWKNMTMNDSRIVFGLEKKLGDIKMFHWQRRKRRNSEKYTTSEPLNRNTSSLVDKYSLGNRIDLSLLIEDEIDLK